VVRPPISSHPRQQSREVNEHHRTNRRWYLTVVVDHHTDRLVGAAAGRVSKTVEQ
jgi:hypothetical protein